MTVDPASYDFVDAEELTVVTVTRHRADDVRALLEARDERLDMGEDGDVDDEYAVAAWAVEQTGDDVVAIEFSGYHDPGAGTLAELSQDGRRAAVARSNIQAHVRFGCAEDGRVLFDDDEYAFAEDPTSVPRELTDLMNAVWVDLDAEEDDDSGPGLFSTALAMAETFTAVRVTPDML